MTRTGHIGEGCVAAVLERRGWIILQRNWRDRYAEVDIVAQDPDGELHLIEVKTRRSHSRHRFDLIETLTARQLRRIRAALPRILATLTTHSPPHIDAAFVLLDGSTARVSFFPDYHE